MIDLSIYEQKIYSQNGEDGITIKLVDLLYDNPYDTNKYYVEFGVQNGDECNTKILREKYNWKGLMMDGNYENISINLHKEFVTMDNITTLFNKYNVPNNINILSIDIDYNDFYCLKEILKVYNCDIIICEYNATHLPNEDKIVIYKEDGCWDSTNYYGASLLSIQKLCNKYNYSLVYCNANGINSFFINNDIIKNKNLNFKNINDINILYRAPLYSNGPNNGHPQDLLLRKYTSFDDIKDFI